MPVFSGHSFEIFRVEFGKKHARLSFQKLSKLHESEGRVEFEVSEKLTSVCFFKLHEKPYLLIIYMK